MGGNTDRNEQRSLALMVIDQSNRSDKEILLAWANDLLAIRENEASSLQKAKDAIVRTCSSEAILPFVKLLGSEIKRVGWDERSLPAKIGLSAGALAAVALSGKGAGIAALGGAIGVPLWVVFGAGGAFAGVLIEEIERTFADQRNILMPQEREVEGEVIEHLPLESRKEPPMRQKGSCQ